MAAKNSSIICKSLADSAARDIKDGILKEAAHTIILLAVAFEYHEEDLKVIFQEINRLSLEMKNRQVEDLYERIKWAEVIASDNVFSEYQQNRQKQNLTKFITILKENIIELQDEEYLNRAFSDEIVAFFSPEKQNMPIILILDDTKKILGVLKKKFEISLRGLRRAIVKRGDDILFGYKSDLSPGFKDSKVEPDKYEDDYIEIVIRKSRLDLKLVIIPKK